MNYATFTLEGYIKFLEDQVEHLAHMNARNDELKGDWSKWTCMDRFDYATNGALSFIIFGTSASDDWEKFCDLNYEYKDKLYEMLK